jgi:Fe-S oxidoreductase
LAQARLEQAAATGAASLVTVCPTCELTLRQAAQTSENGSVKVSNLLDLVWKAIK